MPSGELDALEGALNALLELHYSVDILAEHQLGPRLKEFPLVVIPDAHKLSPEFKEAAVRYVEDGGSLLLLGEKSARLFEPQLGANLTGEPEETAAELDTPAGPGQRSRGLAGRLSHDGDDGRPSLPDPGLPRRG